MKKMSRLLLAILLCLTATACAEDNVSLEVIKIDGVSVVLLATEETANGGRLRAAMADDGMVSEVIEKSAAAEVLTTDFTLPHALKTISEEAFAGIAAVSVEVTEHVEAIGPYAFANCNRLREITIPASVVSIDDHALDGCEDVTVYGVKGSEAERFAAAAGFGFVDVNGGENSTGTPATPVIPQVEDKPPVVMPFVPAD